MILKPNNWKPIITLSLRTTNIIIFQLKLDDRTRCINKSSICNCLKFGKSLRCRTCITLLNGVQLILKQLGHHSQVYVLCV